VKGAPMAVKKRGKYWHLDVTINGKRIRRAIKEAQTQRQAEKAERIIINEIYENRFGIGGQKLFSEFVENSYKPYAKTHKKGYDVEVSTLKSLLETFGKKRLYEITPEEIEKYKRRRTGEKTLRGTIRARSTINREIAVLSAVFVLAKSYGEIKENPVSKVKYFGNLTSRERILTDAEEIKLFERIKGDVKLSRQIEILLYTGLRRGELFKSEWRDVNADEGFLHLRAEITKANRARTVPMLSNVREIFTALKNEAADISPKAKVFPGAKSQPFTLTKKFSDVCSELVHSNLSF
jgi:integrase